MFIFRKKRIFNLIGNCTLLLLSILLMSSCKTKQKIVSVPRANIDNKNTRTLLALLKTNEFNFEHFSAKFSSEITIDSNNVSFNVNMRMRKDSVIWMSISPLLGIEMARIMITKDSVKFINRSNSTYFAGDYNYISKILHSDLDFEMIQSLLIGNSINFYEEEEKLKSSIDNNKYLLSTIRKRRLRRVMEKNKDLKEPVQSIWLEPHNYKVSRIFIDELNSDRTFNATFEEFEKQEDSLFFPYKLNFAIKAEKNIFIGINYSKVTINKSQTFPFSIPEGYELIYYKEK